MPFDLFLVGRDEAEKRRCHAEEGFANIVDVDGLALGWEVVSNFQGGGLDEHGVQLVGGEGQDLRERKDGRTCADEIGVAIPCGQSHGAVGFPRSTPRGIVPNNANPSNGLLKNQNPACPRTVAKRHRCDATITLRSLAKEMKRKLRVLISHWKNINPERSC